MEVARASGIKAEVERIQPVEGTGDNFEKKGLDTKSGWLEYNKCSFGSKSNHRKIGRYKCSVDQTPCTIFSLKSHLDNFEAILAGFRKGYMGRKQRIEATIGRKVPENDGKRHAITPTVSDTRVLRE
ncbi:hypothetical protein IFM89_024271, partial [Coptis chinensis]